MIDIFSVNNTTKVVLVQHTFEKTQHALKKKKHVLKNISDKNHNDSWQLQDTRILREV